MLVSYLSIHFKEWTLLSINTSGVEKTGIY